MQEDINYICVYRDEDVVLEEVNAEFPVSIGVDGKQICQSLIRKTNIRTNRKNPKVVEATLFRLGIKKGSLFRILIGKFTVDVPFSPMTDDELKESLTAICGVSAPEIAEFIREQAYDMGHSGGREEVASIASEIANRLNPKVNNLIKRIREECKKPKN